VQYIKAQWQAPNKVKALTTTRLSGYSAEPFSSLNLGDHVEDAADNVTKNRALLCNDLGLSKPPQWLQQVHGIEVVEAKPDNICRTADACWSDCLGQACIVMTADCLPVFFCDSEGTKVAVAHAGWRGLLGGVLEATLQVFAKPQNVHIWLGPAIGPHAFEVGAEVREQFVAVDQQAALAFISSDSSSHKYFANIYQLAKMRLERAGVHHISGGNFCTFTDEERFFSYRRDGKTGRMASLIWLES